MHSLMNSQALQHRFPHSSLREPSRGPGCQHQRQPLSPVTRIARRQSAGTALGAQQAAAAPPVNDTPVQDPQHIRERLRLSYQASAPCAPGLFLNGATSFAEEHRIRGYEVGPDQTTTISTVANLLQEIAGNHGVALWGRTEAGYATDPLMVKRNLIFAATRMQIQMDHYPRWGDLVKVETWFQPEGRIAACRNWIVSDPATGRELGRATSTWVMVNTLTRKLAKIPDEMRAKFQTLAPTPARSAVAPEQARLKIPDLATPPEIEGPVQVARRSDMDMNGHINNVTYLGWALETVPHDIYLSHTLVEIEVDYKAECMAGDTVECLGGRAEVEQEGAGPGPPRFLHVLRRCQDGRCFELVRARTTWRPRQPLSLP